jgi:zearalenone synthase (highly reducing iterative type I polyketide synthase)
MHSTQLEESISAIAIVGLSCRFPGDASDPLGFWGLLKDGRNGFSQTTDRYNAEAFYHPTGNDNRQNTIPTKGGYFLKQDPYVFDAAFFNITAAEAMALDPRQRIAMEVAYEALENAGIPLQKVKGTQTACFMGSSMSDYRDAVARDFGHFPKYHILGVSDEMISNRISHFLDIHGPSATIQTACSSSLMAAHIACQSLRSGESEMAITGGVGLITKTDGTMHLNNLGFLNSAGHSRSFDADANGYGRGEGCGILILKRLDDAIRDGDTVRAVIRGSGANSDGWTQGVTMPSQSAQAMLIRQVYDSFGLDYGSTQYVEAHGTGTKAGDPIETSAIHSTIGSAKTSSRKRLYVGSVKPNIGHLEAAAGVASIIKGVLALERGLIPPNINFSRANPAIPLDEWNMVVPTKLTPWPAAPTKRMSISGFGMGGTNAHVVMDAYNTHASLSKGVSTLSRQQTKRLFVLSSHDKAGFKRVGKSLAGHLDTLGAAGLSPAYLANLAHTFAKARSGLAWRSTYFAENVAELREQLTATTVGDDAVRKPSNPPRIGFVFTGQGAQWARMGIEMLERPVFRDSVTKSTRFLKAMGCTWDPVTELSKEHSTSRLGVPEISQPICSVLQIALVDELRSWGVTPSKVVGHSSGEIGAAYAMGALSHRDALASAYFRGTAAAGLIKKKQTGGMMAVGCSRDEAEKLMKATKLRATVACVNSPANVTISGDVSTLEALRAILDERGIFARRLKVEVAYHSPHMHLCSQEYYSSIADVGHDPVEEVLGQKPITMISSVLGYEIDSESLGPYYWVQNLINPVLFTDAVKEMVSPADANGEKTTDLLVEIGPHSALGGPIEQILSNHGIINVDYTSMLVRGQSALETSLGLGAQLFRLGVPINVSKVNGDSNCKLLTDLPPYAWNHSEKFCAYGRTQLEQYAQQYPTRSLLGAMLPTMDERERVWRSFIRLNDEPWLRGHKIGAAVLFPAAGMVSIALEAVQQISETGKTPIAFQLRDVLFLAAMSLPEDIATEITVHMRPHLLGTAGSSPAAWWEFTVSSCAGPMSQLRTNCRGLISAVYEETRSSYMVQEDAKWETSQIADYRQILRECPDTCQKKNFYEYFAKSHMQYSEVWQGVENCRPGAGKTCYDLIIHDIGETFTKGKLERPFLIHAAALDAAWQGYLGSTCKRPEKGDFGLDKPMLPKSIGELHISGDIPGDVGYIMPGVCRSHRHGFSELSANINIFDKELSKVVLSVTDFRLSELDMDDAEDVGEGGGVTVDPADIASEVRWDYALDVMEPREVLHVVREVEDSAEDAKLIQVSPRRGLDDIERRRSLIWRCNPAHKDGDSPTSDSKCHRVGSKRRGPAKYSYVQTAEGIRAFDTSSLRCNR